MKKCRVCGEGLYTIQFASGLCGHCSEQQRMTTPDPNVVHYASISPYESHFILQNVADNKMVWPVFYWRRWAHLR